MKIHEGLDGFPTLKFPVVTSGTFDGVHLGHRKIIEKVKNLSHRFNGEAVLLTYWPHPRHVLFPTDTLKILTTFEEKAGILAEAGIDHLIKIPFTKQFSQLSSYDFIHQILVDKVGTKMLVIGYDHKFGRNREGSFESLKTNAHQYGFAVEEIPRKDIENIGISSTKIRKALKSGDLITANKYLGRPYHIYGQVIDGNKLGRELGFPTANIRINDENKLIPGDGIYAVNIRYNGIEYGGMLSIGIRPTIGGKERTIEVNIFDFDQNIYGEYLEIYFIEKFREEIKFETLDELKSQLHKDWKLAKKILS